MRLPQGGPHRALSAGVRRSASTDDDDARGAAGWPRGESCHVAHGALLRARLRHRLSHARRLSGGSGGACGLGGSQGAPSSAAAVDPAASPVSNPAPASWEEILPGSRREGGVWARAVGRSTERSSGPWHLISILSAAPDDRPLLRAHFAGDGPRPGRNRGVSAALLWLHRRPVLSSGAFCAHSPMFQRVGGIGSDRLEQTRTGTKPRPSAGRKCNLSVPSASPAREVVMRCFSWRVDEKVDGVKKATPRG